MFKRLIALPLWAHEFMGRQAWAGVGPHAPSGGIQRLVLFHFLLKLHELYLSSKDAALHNLAAKRAEDEFGQVVISGAGGIPLHEFISSLGELQLFKLNPVPEEDFEDVPRETREEITARRRRVSERRLLPLALARTFLVMLDQAGKKHPRELSELRDLGMFIDTLERALGKEDGANLAADFDRAAEIKKLLRRIQKELGK